MKKALILLLVLFFITSIDAQEKGPKRWEKAIQKFEKMDKQTPQKPGKILFVGSSSIAMWKDIADYFPDHMVLNRGFGGSQFSDLIYYADRIVYPYKPSRVFVYEGDNDIAAGDKPKAILKEAKKLRKMITKNLGEEVPVIFIAPKPSVARWNLKAQYEEANALLKKYAEKKTNTEYADVWTPALDKNSEVLTHIFLKDMLHMTAVGYKKKKKTLLPYMGPAVARLNEENIIGVWEYTLETDQGPDSGTVEFKKIGDILGGVVNTSGSETLSINKVEIREDNILYFEVQTYDDPIKVTVTVDGNTFKGKAGNSQGEFPLIAVRQTKIIK